MTAAHGPAIPYGRAGFTLIEVLVGLIIGTLILGGVMGLISVSLQYTQRVKEKAQVQPVLEAAAQQILADPKKALEGSLSMGGTADAPHGIRLGHAGRGIEPQTGRFQDRGTTLPRDAQLSGPSAGIQPTDPPVRFSMTRNPDRRTPEGPLALEAGTTGFRLNARPRLSAFRRTYPCGKKTNVH